MTQIEKIKSLEVKNKRIIICDPEYIGNYNEGFVVDNLYDTLKCDVFDSNKRWIGSFSSASGKTGIFIDNGDIDMDKVDRVELSGDAFVYDNFSGKLGYFVQKDQDRYALFTFAGKQGNKIIFKSEFTGF